MKSIVRIFIVAMMVVASCASAFAQKDSHKHPNRQQRISREKLAEVEAKHIAHDLAFSDDVTEKFITTYCNYKREIWALGPRQRHSRQGGTSEQENEERIKQRFAISEKILKIRQKYYKEYSQFLTQAQIERVYEQEHKIINRYAKHSHKPSNRNQQKP